MKFHVVLFCSASNTGHSSLFHQFRHILFADLMVTLNENGTDLFSAQYLTKLIKYFADQYAILLLPLFEPSIALFISENSVDVILAVLGFVEQELHIGGHVVTLVRRNQFAALRFGRVLPIVKPIFQGLGDGFSLSDFVLLKTGFGRR